MEASIRDVAKRAGVSISTVSRILNGTAAVSDRKTQAVLEAVEFYRYEPNQFARGLKKQSSRMIGVYFPGGGYSVFDGSYNLELLKGIERSLKNRNYSMVLISETEEYQSRSRKTPRYLEFIRQKKIDGLLLSGLVNQSREEEAFQQIIEEEYPVVYIGKRVHEKGLNVYAQFEQYNVRMLQTLYRCGHRDILFYISWMHENYLEGIQNQVKERMPDLRFHPVVCGFFQRRREELLTGIQKYVCREGCTAICSRSAEEAQMMLNICTQLQLSVPEQVSIITVEHRINDGALLYPQVSAVYVPAQDMGAGAAALLSDCIEEKEITETSIEYTPQYISRDSIRLI